MKLISGLHGIKKIHPEVPEGDWIMWQYTSTGHVNGIEGNVDMNFWYGF